MEKSLPPLLPWLGGKRRLIEDIKENVPPFSDRMIEPFVGGGSVFLAISPEEFIINDLNKELILTYEVVRDDPEELIKITQSFPITKEKFYEIRNLDRKDNFESLPKAFRAARMFFLIRCAFSSLYRENAEGHFNTSWGREVKEILNPDDIRKISKYLKKGKIMQGDYKDALSLAKKGDFVYLDPPYDETFTRYNSLDFEKKDTLDLFRILDDLNQKGVLFMLSNRQSFCNNSLL